ncbi:hypothetical protein [Okeania sp. SIO1I7]|uniref:hypothetical protein n=1 Tax=Okeania sp. SIO1I7 TaxID=2607772 RepID=UPI0013F973E1|nr:hypothetical protein [Okeania sp. SIO1I7]NET29537.1 hypothetical protein [Okeania sp. SIO1I7]
MPIPTFIWAIAGILGGGVALALIFWNQILEWAQYNLFPWIQNNIPSIESQVREAFSAVDNVATSTRYLIRKAWKKLREYLLKQVVKLERQSSGKWKMQVTSWVIKNLLEPEKVSEVVTEKDVDWEDLPPDVRAEWLKLEKSKAEIDVTEYRDQQIDEMDMSA